MPLKIGDLVSRLGKDVHQVVFINEAGDLIETRCVISDGNVFSVGDEEFNMPWRYDRIATTDVRGFWLNCDNYGRAPWQQSD